MDTTKVVMVGAPYLISFITVPWNLLGVPRGVIPPTVPTMVLRRDPTDGETVTGVAITSFPDDNIDVFPTIIESSA